jgi:hypothetical protein
LIRVFAHFDEVTNLIKSLACAMLIGLHLRPPPAMPFITMKEHRAAGSPAELADLADYAMFIKRSPTTDDGSCFILSVIWLYGEDVSSHRGHTKHPVPNAARR